MTQHSAEASPRAKARIAGLFYLLTILAGGFAAFAGGRLAAYGSAANLIATACYIVVTVLFYGLFKPVNRTVSLVAAIVSLVGCMLGAVNSFPFLHVPFNELAIFGLYCLLIGYLIFRSAFLPRILGVLMGIGGLGWLTFVSSSLAHHFAPFNMAPGAIGETSLTIWLLAAGVNSERWKEQARAADSRSSDLPR